MYQSFIGLEIHIQLLTETKVFCGCRAAFGDEPNTNVCPVCLGYPGVLPTLNEAAIRMAYVVARTLNCTLTEQTLFERKNYYYPDLPKNYQISQYGAPLGRDGSLDIEFRGKRKRVRIHEVHLEEDAGKMIHAGDMSLLDYNRAGTPLLEIVTEPDMEIGDEAELLLQQFRRMVRYLGVCDGNMEEGSMRCDANVSVNRHGEGLGSKVEIKNLNSSRFVRKALNHEIARQEEILSHGGTIPQETRQWNENRDLTETMRTKESAHDYRYFPEPDLPPFTTTPEFLQSVEDSLVELPLERRDRFVRDYALAAHQADFLTEERALADYFEATVTHGAEAQTVATWLAGDVRKLLNRHRVELAESPLTPERLAALLGLLAENRIHGKIAKQTLAAVFDGDRDPLEIIRENGWEQITDPAELGALVDDVLGKHPKAVQQIREGDSKPIGFLVGQVMKASSGRAEPRAVQELITGRLELRVVQVLSFGGAISGVRRADGLVEPGDLASLRELFAAEGFADNVRFDELTLGRFLSEEITPRDWATLLSELAARLESGAADGIVIAHGTDTLAYTASLLYWVFADTSVPIVLTASVLPHDRPGEEPHPHSDALRNLKAAVAKAMEGEPGVHVIYGDEDFSPLNLKFEGLLPFGGAAAEGRDPAGARAPGAPAPAGASTSVALGRFRNWNMDRPVYSGRPLSREPAELPRDELTQWLERAVRAVFVAKVFPGMQGDSLIALMNAGVRYFILELFDTGTANLRESPYSLRKAFQHGEQVGANFFCTSQQEIAVDFSEYVTGHELWREGAIPMGGLTTESVYTRLLVALLVAENDEELVKLMED